ncbi:hypothetical protein PPYR_00832 [Photinus pyralis]|uniref:UBX domain-containing protein n=1 Tax=Photinus pyralis TaxID=7054 RepID=A0A1Y1M3L1_PHOPY|nr:UBX domain-containing protein 6 [Photinus pyralis]KAB0803862.1 hypothetical protein PPYR_00832 [Photinus pyralis]
MAEKIKKFFAKKKADAKFKLAGPGRRLDVSSDSSSSSVAPSRPAASRGAPTEATIHAAIAAEARLGSQRKDTNFNTSFGAIQAQVRRELQAGLKNEDPKHSPPSQRHSMEREVELEASPTLAVRGVYYRCPFVSNEILPKDEWKSKLAEFLFEQLEAERCLTACLIIHSCNYNRTKISDGVEVLCKYLDNIIANPDEPKFHKIRCSNATFKEKVLPLVGSTELLYAAGFRQQSLEHNGVMEEFWVFEKDNIEEMKTLLDLRETLKEEARIDIELDRNAQVLFAAQASARYNLPPDFFQLSPEELKKEQQSKTEMMEKQMQLRTKVMREREEQRELRRYKYALIRVRFPDDCFLQGTFSVYEKFSAVVEFVQEHLNESAPFILYSTTGHKLEETDYDSTLLALKLVPATVLIFGWDTDSADETNQYNTYLKPETMILAQPL